VEPKPEIKGVVSHPFKKDHPHGPEIDFNMRLGAVLDSHNDSYCTGDLKDGEPHEYYKLPGGSFSMRHGIYNCREYARQEDVVIDTSASSGAPQRTTMLEKS